MEPQAAEPRSAAPSPEGVDPAPRRRPLAPGSPAREMLKRRFPALRPAVGTLISLRYRLRFLREAKPDRHILEDVIFPALLADPSLRRVLFVGCDWYTSGYAARFAGREYWTIDVDDSHARHGSDRHIVDSLSNLAAHFPPDSLDVVVCNGVFGFGLDGRAECEAAFAGCLTRLRPGGLLIVGWNDLDPYRPFPLESLDAIRAFDPHVLEPLTSPRYPTFSPLRHTFDVYRRPGETGAAP